jgi:HSP20 family protein
MFVPWNRWQEMSRLEDAMNQLFRNPTRRDAETASAAATWQPAVDIFEDGEKIVLLADLPGVEQQDIELAIDKSVLTLRGERRIEQPKAEEYHRFERVRGAFARSFTLPPSVDGERVSADLKNGVLALTLPKKREAQPRQIKVSVA